MKITSLKVKNTKSFKEEVEIDFQDDFNILIGPNGGGKSNLLDIITIVIRKYFLKGWEIKQGNDPNGRPWRDLRLANLFSQEEKELERFFGNDGEARIAISLKVEIEDIQNIQTIKEHKEEFERVLHGYRNTQDIFQRFSSIEQWDIEDLSDEQEFTYVIIDHNLENPDEDFKRIFLEYLNHFEGFVLLNKEIDTVQLHPTYLYFSPYRGAEIENLQANLSSQDYTNLLIDYFNSSSNNLTSLIELATFYFAEKRRDYEVNANEEGYGEKWIEDDEVQLVSDKLDSIGYSWKLETVNQNENIYSISLRKGDQELTLEQTSSGEREIMNFLLGIFAFNIKNGMIIVDEPQLHLHPKWQKFLIDLFLQLTRSTGNQFIISTHSSVFINRETIAYVKRVYMDDENSSQVVSLDEEGMGSAKDLLHMINSTNNEKIFFADKVILVEGPTDRLIFQTILNYMQEDSTRVTEVVDVGGKHNFDKYRDFLNSLEIDNYIIADLDYVNEIGEERIKSLFKVNKSRIKNDVLKNEKSKDGNKLVEELEKAIHGGDLEELKAFWEYIKSFRREPKGDLSDTEQEILNGFIEDKKEQDVYILKHGDINSYFPKGYRGKDLNNAIELTQDDNFEEWISGDGNQVEELTDIVSNILS